MQNAKQSASALTPLSPSQFAAWVVGGFSLAPKRRPRKSTRAVGAHARRGGDAADRPGWRAAGASHQGGRAEQQDRWALFTSADGAGLLAVLADGLGGHGGGAQAAQQVIDTARECLANQASLFNSDPQEALAQLCQTAHRAIGAASATARSTVAVVWLHGGRAWWLHVGDSRVYLLRDGARRFRTRDHSAVQLLFDSGEISEAEMATHPFQNRLYRSLGGETSPIAVIGGDQLIPGDRLILCSDGVWERISDAELWAAGDREDLEAAAQGVVNTAVTRGGVRADNATLVLVNPQGGG